MTLFLITVLIFAFVMLIMAIGVIAGRACIKGSCGGLGNCEFCHHKGKKDCDHHLMCQGGGEAESDVGSQEI